MITIKCTKRERIKLEDPKNMVICYIVNALIGCKGNCNECRRNRNEIINWEITDEN